MPQVRVEDPAAAREVLARASRRLVGWGAAHTYAQLAPLLPATADYLVDGDPELWHGARFGRAVHAPARLAEEDDALVLIFSAAHDAIGRRIDAEMGGACDWLPAASLVELLADPDGARSDGERQLAWRRAWTPRLLAVRPRERIALLAPPGAARIGVEVARELGLAPAAVLVETSGRREAADKWVSADGLAPAAVLVETSGQREATDNAERACEGVPVYEFEEGLARARPERLVAPAGDAGTRLARRADEAWSRVRAQRVDEAVAEWSEFCAELERAPLEPRERARRWGDARQRLYRETGPFPIPERDRERLDSLRDRHRGERIFVLGNGPSLNRIDLERLAGEHTFGFNRIDLLYERVSWRLSFYTAFDWRVTPDIADVVNGLEAGTLFFPQRFRGLLREGEDVYWYWSDDRMPDGHWPPERRFSLAATEGVRMGASVAVAGIQLAYHMGFDPIYLVGFDLDYRISTSTRREDGHHAVGRACNLVGTADDDSAHFDPRYFGRGSRWHEPSIEGMQTGFRNCRDAITGQGRRIYNATPGGRLHALERVDFASLFPRVGRHRRRAREGRARGAPGIHPGQNQ